MLQLLRGIPFGKSPYGCKCMESGREGSIDVLTCNNIWKNGFSLHTHKEICVGFDRKFVYLRGNLCVRISDFLEKKSVFFPENLGTFPLKVRNFPSETSELSVGNLGTFSRKPRNIPLQSAELSVGIFGTFRRKPRNIPRETPTLHIRNPEIKHTSTHIHQIQNEYTGKKKNSVFARLSGYVPVERQVSAPQRPT